MSIITLAIKTIPDIATGRRLYDIDNLSDTGVVKAMLHLQQQNTGNEELPLYLQRIVSIALISNVEGTVQTFSLKEEGEAALLQAYIAQIQQYDDAQLVTWHGLCHEFPILRYRALKYGLTLPNISQIDLSHTLDAHSKHPPSLAEISLLLHLPPLSAFTMEQTWQAWLENKHTRIHQAAIYEAENIYRIQEIMIF